MDDKGVLVAVDTRRDDGSVVREWVGDVAAHSEAVANADPDLSGFCASVGVDKQALQTVRSVEFQLWLMTKKTSEDVCALQQTNDPAVIKAFADEFLACN